MKITVVGLGHLGTVAAGALAAAGHQVSALDIDDGKVRELRSGRLHIHEPGLQECVSSALDRGNLRFSQIDEFSDPPGEVALVATGTPAATDGNADLAQVRSALDWLKRRNSANLTVVMKSTVPPGSGASFIRNELKGLNVNYVANPEFLREGRALQDWTNPDRIVLGAEQNSSRGIEAVKRMYAGIDAPVLVTDTTSAEMIKYASNAFLATRISFINEIATLCDAVGASIDSVSDGLALDARTGSKVHAGVGYGGSCFPKDIMALERLAARHRARPGAAPVRERGKQTGNAACRWRLFWPGSKGDLRGVDVGVLGLAFKPGTNDVRGAVALDVIGSLHLQGARVRAYDPKASDSALSLLPADVELVDTPEQAAEGAQAILLLTEWAQIVGADWAAIASGMCPPRFLFDGRNALDADRMSRLGFEYLGIGRPAQGSDNVHTENWKRARPVSRNAQIDRSDLYVT